MFTKSDVKAIKGLLENLATKEELKPIQQDVKVIKTDVAKIRKDISAVVDFFDSEYLNLRKRVERIEEHLGLTPLV